LTNYASDFAQVNIQKRNIVMYKLIRKATAIEINKRYSTYHVEQINQTK